jgi:hypothetical protein
MFEQFWSMTGVRASYNSTYKKLAVQWLNEVLCFVSSLLVTDSFVLRNRQLLVAAKRYSQCQKNETSNMHKNEFV